MHIEKRPNKRTIEDFFRGQSAQQTTSSSLTTHAAPQWGKLLQEADTNTLKRRLSIGVSSDMEPIMYYTPYFEPIFQDKRAPGLGNAHKYWTKVSTLLFLQSELAPTGDLERSSPISWEYEGGDSEHGRGRQLQRNLQWVIEIALEQLSHVLSATEVEVLKRFAANTRPLESVGILKPSLWFRDSCTYSDQESKCAHPTPFAGVARRLEYTSSKTLCLELEHVLGVLPRDVVTALANRCTPCSSTTAYKWQTKKEAVNALLQLEPEAVQQQQFLRALRTTSKQQSSAVSAAPIQILRWTDQCVCIVRKAIGLVFGLAGLEPEEVTGVWKVDITRIRWAYSRMEVTEEAHGSACAYPQRWTFHAPLTTEEVSQWWAALGLCDEQERAVRRGDADAAYRTMHEASNALLSFSSLSEYCYSGIRSLTLDWLVRSLCRGIHLKEREKRYEDAVHYINSFFQSACTGPLPTRGKLWVRLVMNTQRLSRLQVALELCERALCEPDPCPANKLLGFSVDDFFAALPGGIAGASGGFRIDLESQLRKLAVPPRRWKLPAAPERLQPLWRTLCLKKEAVDEHGLEEAVIQTLTRGPESIYEGYQGMHCENSIWLTLFVILMWKVLYGSSAPSVASHQHCPAALRNVFTIPVETNPQHHALTTAFGSISQNCAVQVLQQHFHEFRGLVAYAIDWDRFSLEDVLVPTCALLPPSVLIAVCANLLRCFEVWRHGFPDLLLWRTSTTTDVKGDCVAIEVKGPGDSLSSQQKAWLDVLARAGMKVEVVRVEY